MFNIHNSQRLVTPKYNLISLKELSLHSYNVKYNTVICVQELDPSRFLQFSQQMALTPRLLHEDPL